MSRHSPSTEPLGCGEQRPAPEAAAVIVAEEALKEAAWAIADEIACADWEPTDFAMTAGERAASVVRINRLMGAAARLAGFPGRDDWSKDMINARALAQDI